MEVVRKMYEQDTIVAISTPIAKGGIGIVRISGPKSKEIASKVFKSISSKSVSSLKGYQATFGRVFNECGDIDEAILLNFNAPNSYTGEDVVEISIHSGIYLLKQTLRAIIAAGARLAESGEFTKRAFLNGKISLTQAESVMDLIAARSGQAARAALAAKDGVIFKQVSEITNQLVGLAGHLSACIDYPEEDITDMNRDDITKVLEEVENKLINLSKTFDLGKIVREGINTVIIGKPNVGKSTIMNLLSGYEKSIVTDIPGTTRDIVEEDILIDDIVLNLADTAGLRETMDIVEKKGIDLAKKRLDSADIIIAVFDNSCELEGKDKEIIAEIKNRTCLAVVNKIDLMTKTDIEYIKSYIPNVVTLEGTKISERKILVDAIKDLLKVRDIDLSTALIANERQLECTLRAISNLQESVIALREGLTYDAIIVCVESAIDPLLELTGSKVADVILDEIFSKFCVGK